MHLQYQEANAIYEQLCKSSLKDLVQALFRAAVRYANIRTEWEFLDVEERVEMNLERTAAHDRFIDACNILSRNQVTKGEDATWRQKIGTHRKDIGDFACYLHAIIGIKNR